MSVIQGEYSTWRADIFATWIDEIAMYSHCSPAKRKELAPPNLCSPPQSLGIRLRYTNVFKFSGPTKFLQCCVGLLNWTNRPTHQFVQKRRKMVSMCFRRLTLLGQLGVDSTGLVCIQAWRSIRRCTAWCMQHHLPVDDKCQRLSIIYNKLQLNYLWFHRS